MIAIYRAAYRAIYGPFPRLTALLGIICAGIVLAAQPVHIAAAAFGDDPHDYTPVLVFQTTVTNLYYGDPYNLFFGYMGINGIALPSDRLYRIEVSGLTSAANVQFGTNTLGTACGTALQTDTPYQLGAGNATTGYFATVPDAGIASRNSYLCVRYQLDQYTEHATVRVFEVYRGEYVNTDNPVPFVQAELLSDPQRAADPPTQYYTYAVQPTTLPLRVRLDLPWYWHLVNPASNDPQPYNQYNDAYVAEVRKPDGQTIVVPAGIFSAGEGYDFTDPGLYHIKVYQHSGVPVVLRLYAGPADGLPTITPTPTPTVSTISPTTTDIPCWNGSTPIPTVPPGVPCPPTPTPTITPMPTPPSCSVDNFALVVVGTNPLVLPLNPTTILYSYQGIIAAEIVWNSGSYTPIPTTPVVWSSLATNAPNWYRVVSTIEGGQLAVCNPPQRTATPTPSSAPTTTPTVPTATPTAPTTTPTATVTSTPTTTSTSSPTPGGDYPTPIPSMCIVTPTTPAANLVPLPDLSLQIPTFRPLAAMTVTIVISFSGIITPIQTFQAGLQTPIAQIGTITAGYSWQGGQQIATDWTARIQPILGWLAIFNPAHTAYDIEGGPLWALAPVLKPILPVISITMLVSFVRLFLWLVGWLLTIVDVIIKLIELIPGE